MIEEQSTRFICKIYRGKQNDSVLLTKEWCTEQLEQAQTLTMQNIWAAQQILLKIVLTLECGDGETIYTFHLYSLPGKQNGNVFLM